MIKAVIFDMDGVVINTIPLGKRAEYEIFKKHGIFVREEMYKDTIGLREDETIAYWCKKYRWHNIDQKEVLQEYFEYYKKAINREGMLMEGVLKSLRFFQSKQIKLALASSSFMRQIKVVVEKFHLEHFFDVIYSAENEVYGKPHPSVYITTADKLAVSPTDCLAIEDSLNGIISAKAARMQCLYVPLAEIDDRALCIADCTLPSLTQLNDDSWLELNAH